MITIVGSATNIFYHILLVEVGNMKFCDKLIKLRKENNLSQEQFADKLGVSRQAVSKWESGGTYPDMEKMIKMCKILNCNLEDLMDDGVIGESNEQKSKVNFESYFRSFLSYITKIYNMFCSMRFKEVVKCILELLFIGLVIFAFSQIVVSFVNSFVLDMLLYIGGNVGLFLHQFFYSIIQIVIGIIDIIIFLHIFKIRYLDYYVTVEDQNVKEKTIETSIEQPKVVRNDKKIKEKIVIRDPKHSTFTFFDFLTKIVIFFIKLFAIFIEVFVVIIFICFLVLVVFFLSHVQYGILFLFLAMIFIGLLFICYIFIHLIYNFIFDQNSHLKTLFIIFIISISIIGISGGLTAATLINYEYVEEDLKYTIKEKYIDVTENTFFTYEDDERLKFIIDDSYKKTKIELKEYKNMKYDLNHHVITNNGKIEEYYYLTYYYSEGYKLYKQCIEDIKNKKIRNYNYTPEIKVYITKENYNKLMLASDITSIDEDIENEE